MAITFKQVIQTTPASGASFNVSITPNAAGNLLIIGIGMNQKGIIKTVTDNNGNAWIPIIFNVQEGNSGGALYHVPNCQAGATTITVTLLNAEALVGLIVTEYSGCAIYHPVDGVAIGFGSSGTANSTANLTTIQNNDVIFSFCVFMDQNIASIGGGYTLRSSLGTNAFTATGDLAAPSPGTYAGHWNEAVSGDWSIMAVGLSSVDNPTPTPVPVQSAFTENLTPTSPITATFSNNVTAGNSIAVLCLGATTQTWTGVTDSEGNSYAACTGASVAGCQMFVSFGGTHGTANAVHAAYTGTSGASGVYVLEVRDITTYDTGHGNSGTGTTATPGSFTLVKPNEIVMAATINSGSALDPGGNDSTYYSIWQTIPGFADVIEYMAPLTGAQNPVANLNGSQTWSMIAGGFYTPQNGPTYPSIVNGPYDSANPNVTYSNPVTKGNLLVACFIGNTAAGTTVTDNASPTPNTWIQAVENTGIVRRSAIWYTVANSNQATLVVTMNGSSNPTGTTAVEITQADTLDQTSQASGTSTAVSCGTLTMNHTGIIVACSYVNGTSTAGSGGNWVYLSNVKGNMFETLVSAAPGLYPITGTGSPSGEFDGCAAGFYSLASAPFLMPPSAPKGFLGSFGLRRMG